MIESLFKTCAFFVVVLLSSAAFAQEIRTGAEKYEAYLPLMQKRKVALVVNHASVVGSRHLVDLLQERGVNVTKIFAPEHGFRGMADAGEHLEDGIDKKSGLPIISLYGKHKKPSRSDLEEIGLVVFDIQDVGVRFYTYLSTLHYVMEAAAENGVPVIVFDRPNPNANRIDGPVLQAKFRSFVGLHPVPLLYGMTIGEYAMMINGEGWLKEGIRCDLKVIPLQNYSHSDSYHLAVKPSPNLPNDLSIALYPSLALFEGTEFSAGRGTTKQFQLYGSPHYGKKRFSFVPEPGVGARYPKHEGKVCFGVDLSVTDLQAVRSSKNMNLSYLLDAYSHSSDKEGFFLKNNFFDRLAGSDALRQDVIAGKSEQAIRASWEEELKRFRSIREKYLLYP